MCNISINQVVSSVLNEFILGNTIRFFLPTERWVAA